MHGSLPVILSSDLADLRHSQTVDHPHMESKHMYIEYYCNIAHDQGQSFVVMYKILCR